MKTVLYVGQKYGSAAKTILGHRYVFGGNKAHRINTLAEPHADDLMKTDGENFLIIDTEQAVDTRFVDRLLESVMVTQAEMTEDQRTNLVQAGIVSVGQLIKAETKDICEACAATTEGAERIRERVMLEIGMITEPAAIPMEMAISSPSPEDESEVEAEAAEEKAAKPKARAKTKK